MLCFCMIMPSNRLNICTFMFLRENNKDTDIGVAIDVRYSLMLAPAITHKPGCFTAVRS